MILTAVMRQGNFDSSDYPELKIDGTSLEAAISEWTKNPDIAKLVPAHAWLYDDAELKLAWERLLSCNVGQVCNVPLLICDSDMDLHCTVLVAEQQCLDGEFVWSKFGFSLDRELRNIEWLSTTPLIRFARTNFVDEIFKYADLCGWSIEY